MSTIQDQLFSQLLDMSIAYYVNEESDRVVCQWLRNTKRRRKMKGLSTY
jgi:hypothetical protein